MSALAHSIADLRDHLLVLESWVLRNKEGLTREQARRIFQRYTTPQAAGEATPDGTDHSKARSD